MSFLQGFLVVMLLSVIALLVLSIYVRLCKLQNIYQDMKKK